MKIEELSYAINPGSHCDLFGAVMVAAGIENLKILVVGTEECTYYSKNFIFEYGKKQKDDSLLMLSLTDKEIVLGIEEVLIKTIDEIVDAYSPEVILIVTTCIVELMGEDIEGIIKSIETRYRTKILLMRTEHFKCDNYIKGMAKTINILGELIENSNLENKSKSFNILGMRYKGGEKSKISLLLKEKGVNINSIVPYSLKSLIDIKSLSNVKLNIVVDFTGLELAEYMERKFSIPYVSLLRIGKLEELKEEYLKIENILEISIKNNIEEALDKILYLRNKIQEKNINNKTAIIAPISVSAVEIGILLEQIGIIPEIMIVKDIYNFEEEDAKYLSENYSSRYIKSGNLEPIRDLYKEMDIDYFIGMEYPQLLKKYGIKHLNINYLADGKFGLEAGEEILSAVLKECD
ncbi:nitrogenase component 1 [Fusobacterium ulcerans]|uniref:nitrogenase component 1 n=1 Tax=Fusobacterium ulcerans TaxID=861 RepID=UPI0034AAC0B3